MTFPATSAADQPNLGFLPDPLHLRTCGIAPSEIAKVDPARIFFAQICDGPLAIPADIAGVIDEARTGRLLPGSYNRQLAGQDASQH